MWVDDHGSEILTVWDCRRLLAEAAAGGGHGHIGAPCDGAPLVLPLDYGMFGSDVIVRVGAGLRSRLVGRLVAFQVDGVELGRDGAPAWRWSVLVRGPAAAAGPAVPPDVVRVPSVESPGSFAVCIRSDRVTGRRLPAAGAAPLAHGAARL